MFAITDMSEFIGKDMNKDRERSWISKVNFAYLRYQALHEEKCIVLPDLLTGPARNWYKQVADLLVLHGRTFRSVFSYNMGQW